MTPRQAWEEWTRTDLAAEFFTAEEEQRTARDRLSAARRVDPATGTVVIASWENRFAAAGGVRAVTRAYAKHLADAGRATVVLTPLHTGLADPPGALRPLGTFWQDFTEDAAPGQPQDRHRHRVELLEDRWAGVRWIYLHASDFFRAEGGRDASNPYLYRGDRGRAGRSPRLVRDALFFALCVPRTLMALGSTRGVVIHLQDWETAGAALTVKEAILRREIASTIVVLTLHNPYDQRLPKYGWRQLTRLARPAEPSFLKLLFYADAPPTTVSRRFSEDLMRDPLQTTYFADHLQDLFATVGIIGVDNGPFVDLDPPFSGDAVLAAKRGRLESILREKDRFRRRMREVMSAYRPPEQVGAVELDALPDDVPLFVSTGRLDERQKGFDVLARAIERLLDPASDDRIDARFVIACIPGDAAPPFADDLQSLAERHPEQVVLYPIRMRRGYLEIQAGASFAVWPSFYEPFGGVSEYLSRGTPLVARATGGLAQQMVDFDQTTGVGNGVLYETRQIDEADWKEIMNASDPADRLSSPGYVAQVDALEAAIRRAAAIFRDDRQYGRLLSNLQEQQDAYSWRRAAREYGGVYRLASARDRR